jgi:hypothetical protein
MVVAERRPAVLIGRNVEAVRMPKFALHRGAGGVTGRRVPPLVAMMSVHVVVPAL